MGSKIDGPSGPRPRFFIIGLRHFQRGIGYYTWLACKTDISEEVRSHQSNVTKRRDMTLDWWLLTSSEMSFCMLAPIPRWKWLCPTMKNRGLGPLGPSILDPIYVIYAFGSMLSCILCERQNFFRKSQIEALWCPKSSRAARFVTVWFIGCSLNAMELVVRN